MGTQKTNKAGVESLGLTRIESVTYYVHDLERSRRFYTETMDFAELGVCSPELEQKGRQKSVAFQAGDLTVICAQGLKPDARASRYLRKHPDGIGTLTFGVKDIEKTFKLLDARGGTPISEIQTASDGNGGTLKFFSITTPFGDTTFRFVQRDGFKPLFPGFVPHAQVKGGTNRYGFSHLDHVTSNFQTMSPALLWMEHVMGFERFWNIEFHTDDVKQTHDDKGSGLRSIVMWDPESGAKFANNEPLRPHFKQSQINIFNEDHRGDGVQHIAIALKDIVGAVKAMRESKRVEFMPTPGTYYDALPKRLEDLKIGKIDEEIDVLRRLEILVDGDRAHSYLLQIFMKDAASLYKDPAAGPFFYEIIQRKGDQGFGAGNFRALFESIERQQLGEIH